MTDQESNNEVDKLKQQICLLKAQVSLIFAVLIIGSLLAGSVWLATIIVALSIITQFIAKRMR